jgi:hypothetical protein
MNTFQCTSMTTCTANININTSLIILVTSLWLYILTQRTLFHVCVCVVLRCEVEKLQYFALYEAICKVSTQKGQSNIFSQWTLWTDWAGEAKVFGENFWNCYHCRVADVPMVRMLRTFSVDKWRWKDREILCMLQYRHNIESGTALSANGWSPTTAQRWTAIQFDKTQHSL